MSETSPKNILGTMPVATVIQLLVAVFALGGIWNRFQSLEKDHSSDKLEIEQHIKEIEGNIVEIESNKASKTEVSVTHQRLTKYIDRFNSHVEQSRSHREQLKEEIMKIKFGKYE